MNKVSVELDEGYLDCVERSKKERFVSLVCSAVRGLKKERR